VASARSADSSSARGPARAKQQAAQLRQLEIELTAPAEPTVRMAEGSLQESRALVLGAPETLIGVKSRSRLFATGRRLNEHEEGA
jgi:hypothetical protein